MQLSRRRSTLRRIQILAALATACAISWPSSLSAHGPVPAVLSIVDEDASGPTLVRLNGGLARRDGKDRFRYLCPIAWDDEIVLPAAKIPDGPVAIAAGRGVYLLDAAGRATPHPDPSAAGPSTEFARLGDTLYLLRVASGQTQVLAVDAESVRVVFEEPGSWSSIAATADELGLMRLFENRVEQLRLTGDGEVVERSAAWAPDGAYVVIARATSDTLYAVIVTPAGRELGTFEGNAWTRIASAVASIAGPIDGPEGVVVGIDTSLLHLPERPAALFEGTVPVSCLGRLGEQTYACTREGVSALGVNGLGDSIFALSWLRAPDHALVAESQRERCELQWEHFRFDLLALGVPLVEPNGSGGSAAPPPTAAGRGGSGKPKPTADGGGRQESRSGCRAAGIGAVPPSRWHAATWLTALFSLACFRRRSADHRQRAIQERAK